MSEMDSDLTAVPDIPLIKISKAKELLELLSRGGNWKFNHNLDLGRVRLEFTLAHNVSQETNRGAVGFSFLGFNIEFIFKQPLAHEVHMLCVLLQWEKIKRSLR